MSRGIEKKVINYNFKENNVYKTQQKHIPTKLQLQDTKTRKQFIDESLKPKASFSFIPKMY